MADEPSDFVIHTCVSVTCGACKEPYNDDEYGQLHFESVDEAVKWLTEYGWKIVGDVARCRSCALSEECAQKGHVWDDWWHCRCGCHGQQPKIRHPQPMECRTCARCEEGEERVMIS